MATGRCRCRRVPGFHVEGDGGAAGDHRAPRGRSRRARAGPRRSYRARVRHIPARLRHGVVRRALRDLSLLADRAAAYQLRARLGVQVPRALHHAALARHRALAERRDGGHHRGRQCGAGAGGADRRARQCRRFEPRPDGRCRRAAHGGAGAMRPLHEGVHGEGRHPAPDRLRARGQTGGGAATAQTGGHRRRAGAAWRVRRDGARRRRADRR